jgi:hypothetical protein
MDESSLNNKPMMLESSYNFKLDRHEIRASPSKAGSLAHLLKVNVLRLSLNYCHSHLPDAVKQF